MGVNYKNLQEEINQLLTNSKINLCTDQGFNMGKEYAIRELHVKNPDLVSICYGILCVNDDMIDEYVEQNKNSFIKETTLTEEQYKSLSIICSKLNGSGKKVGFGVGGSVVGNYFFGILGAIAGGVLGAMAGDKYNKNDRDKFYQVLTEGLTNYYAYLYRKNLLVNDAVNMPQSNFHLMQKNNSAPVNKVYESSKVKTAQEELDKLIGLEGIKREVLKLKAILHKFQNNPSEINLNMIFYGNPGTGKTEVARIIAKLLYEEGILPQDKLIETDSSGLIAEYVGQTAVKTHAKIKEAMGGVLFIDEAYALNDGVHYGGGSYGKEAVVALLKDMEDYRGKFCVILAGYRDEMNEMLSLNPGFRSRINRNLDFPDYSVEELIEIAKFMLKKKGYTMTDSAIAEIAKVLEFLKLAAQVSNKPFANAREVRNLLESLYEIFSMVVNLSLNIRKSKLWRTTDLSIGRLIRLFRLR